MSLKSVLVCASLIGMGVFGSSCRSAHCPSGTLLLDGVCVSDGGMDADVDGDVCLQNGCPLSVSLFAGGVDLINFEPEVADYTVSVGFALSEIQVRVTPLDEVATVTWQGLAQTLDGEGFVTIRPPANATAALVVRSSSGSTYAVNVTRLGEAEFAQSAYIKASSVESEAFFGASVAISRETLVVGAPESGAVGQVFVYRRSGDQWLPESTLTASNGDADDHFGVSVAIDGDTIVVGANQEAATVQGGPQDNSLRSAGAAYVFVRNNAGWKEQAYIKASNTDEGASSGDRFGTSVAIWRDTMIVGAPSEDSSPTGGPSDNSINGAGAVYVYVRVGSAWSQQAFLKGSNTVGEQHFGRSVALSDQTAVVGAWLESAPAGSPGSFGEDESGAAYVFERSGTSWIETAYLKSPGADFNDHFGVSVAVEGDAIAVGAPGDDGSTVGGPSDDGSTNDGAVFVFTRNGAVWAQHAYLKAADTASGDFFGSSVALSGDTLVIGAPAGRAGSFGEPQDNSSVKTGVAYLFLRSGATWEQESRFDAVNGGAGDSYGASVAIGGEQVMVGATGESASGANAPNDNSSSNSGAVYVFR